MGIGLLGFDVYWIFNAYNMSTEYSNMIAEGDYAPPVYYPWIMATGFILFSHVVQGIFIRKRISNWNKAIDNRDMSEIKKYYKPSPLGIGVIFGTVLTVEPNIFKEDKSDSLLTNPTRVLGISLIIIDVLLHIQYRRLDKAVFEEDIKKALSSPIIVSPYFRQDYSGIMVVKRF